MICNTIDTIFHQDIVISGISGPSELDISDSGLGFDSVIDEVIVTFGIENTAYQ
jgi:hypothetical protein